MAGTLPSNSVPGSRTPADPAPVEAVQSLAVLRSEEQLRVGSRVRVSGRAVLRRYVVTETVTQTFEVSHEEVRVDYEPVDDGDDAAPDGPVFDDRVVEMVLHRQVPVVQLQVVATERVRLHVDTVTEQVPVSAALDRERIDVDLPAQLP